VKLNNGAELACVVRSARNGDARARGSRGTLDLYEREVEVSKNYVAVSGVVFGFIAVAQIARALARLPLHVGTVEVPVLASSVAAVVAGGLCIWAFRSQG
jgi:hypothetical protein